ncbi:MAG: hypothetical protein V4467_04720 [Patescibacteria group bacterium]
MSNVTFINLTGKIVRILNGVDRITVIREIPRTLSGPLEVSETAQRKMVFGRIPVLRPAEKRITNLPHAELEKGYYFVVPRALKAFVPPARVDVLCPGVDSCFLEDDTVITCSFLEGV